MSELIQHVSDTAFWVAYFRFHEGQRKKPLFQDPLAGVLAGDHGKTIARRMGNYRMIKWTLAMRTYVIDSILQEQIEKGVDTVINLGAGLDTRPYRMNLPPELHWIEVDFPALIEFKESRLKQEKPRCHLQRIPLDLRQPMERRELFHRINAETKKALILTEGVVPYLSEENAGELARDLFQETHFAYWITDYFSRLFVRLSREGRIKTNLPKNVSFLFNPQNWQEFYRQNGWVVDRMYYMGEIGRQIDRPMPLPFYARLLAPFMGEERRRSIRQMTGYALLRRRD